MNKARLALAVGGVLVLAGAGSWLWLRHAVPTGPPPRATARIVTPAVASTIVLPLYVDLADLDRMLDQQIPTALWRIDLPDAVCVAPQHVHLFGKSLAITPRMHCHITGSAVRGPITLRGAGRTLVADVPILAHVDADHIGGLASTHADGQTMVHIRCSFAVARNWQPRGSVALSYDWTVPPAIMLLGQRIPITDKADQRLKPVVARIEQKLPDLLQKVDLRGKVGALWRRGFAVVNLNDRNPPVWMRVVPQTLSYNGYAIDGGRLRLDLGLAALTQAVVGARPADPPATPLPDMARVASGDGRIHLFVPVSADYAALVPVITRALGKRSLRPFDVPGIGAVDAHFANIAVFGATQGRIAVGADIVAVPRNAIVPAMRGRIWFAGKPHNAPGSQQVRFSDLHVSGATDNPGGTLLVAVGNAPGFADAIADALTQNFTHDFTKLQDKIQRAIADRAQGDLRIHARLDSARNDTIAAYADGLFMPVWVTGQASVTYDATPH